jgi:hypothetical protein
MAKLTLNPAPTFKKVVEIPTPNGVGEVTFEFKHKDRVEMAEFLVQRQARAEASAKKVDKSNLVPVVKDAVERDADMVLDIAVGWDLDDEFSRESIVTLIRKFDQAALSIIETYGEANSGQKQKN